MYRFKSISYFHSMVHRCVRRQRTFLIPAIRQCPKIVRNYRTSNVLLNFQHSPSGRRVCEPCTIRWYSTKRPKNELKTPNQTESAPTEEFSNQSLRVRKYQMNEVPDSEDIGMRLRKRLEMKTANCLHAVDRQHRISKQKSKTNAKPVVSQMPTTDGRGNAIKKEVLRETSENVAHMEQANTNKIEPQYNTQNAMISQNVFRKKHIESAPKIEMSKKVLPTKPVHNVEQFADETISQKCRNAMLSNNILQKNNLNELHNEEISGTLSDNLFPKKHNVQRAPEIDISEDDTVSEKYHTAPEKTEIHGQPRFNSAEFLRKRAQFTENTSTRSSQSVIKKQDIHTKPSTSEPKPQPECHQRIVLPIIERDKPSNQFRNESYETIRKIELDAKNDTQLSRPKQHRNILDVKPLNFKLTTADLQPTIRRKESSQLKLQAKPNTAFKTDNLKDVVITNAPLDPYIPPVTAINANSNETEKQPYSLTKATQQILTPITQNTELNTQSAVFELPKKPEMELAPIQKCIAPNAGQIRSSSGGSCNGNDDKEKDKQALELCKMMSSPCGGTMSEADRAHVKVICDVLVKKTGGGGCGPPANGGGGCGQAAAVQAKEATCCKPPNDPKKEACAICDKLTSACGNSTISPDDKRAMKTVCDALCCKSAGNNGKPPGNGGGPCEASKCTRNDNPPAPSCGKKCDTTNELSQTVLQAANRPESHSKCRGTNIHEPARDACGRTPLPCGAANSGPCPPAPKPCNPCGNPVPAPPSPPKDCNKKHIPTVPARPCDGIATIVPAKKVLQPQSGSSNDLIIRAKSPEEPEYPKPPVKTSPCPLFGQNKGSGKPRTGKPPNPSDDTTLPEHGNDAGTNSGSGYKCQMAIGQVERGTVTMLIGVYEAASIGFDPIELSSVACEISTNIRPINCSNPDRIEHRATPNLRPVVPSGIHNKCHRKYFSTTKSLTENSPLNPYNSRYTSGNGRSDAECLKEYSKCDSKCRMDMVRPDCMRLYELGFQRCEEIKDAEHLKLTGCDAVLRAKSKLKSVEPKTGRALSLTSSRKCKR